MVNMPFELLKFIPSILKVNPLVDDLTVIDPVAMLQVGCVVTTVGSEGDGSGGFTVKLTALLMQPKEFFAVRL